MRSLAVIFCVLVITTLIGCDLRSDTAKREMEKFSGTPTPTLTPAPAESPIDPSEIVQADPNLQGQTITVNGQDQKKAVVCKQLDRVMINGSNLAVTIKGACRQIMVNGSANHIDLDAAFEFVLNGDNNTIKYSRYVNGKRPIIQKNAAGNTVEKAEAAGGNH